MAVRHRVALIGDYNPGVIAHQAIPRALELCAAEGIWRHTASIVNAESQLSEFDGIWCVPASPYANMEGALEAIRFARESGRPFLGTCAGFQHALIEYARNVCGLQAAAHAETHPDAPVALIVPLSCALVEREQELSLSDGRVRRAYGTARITEGYHCSYGLNRDYEGLLFGNELRATVHDDAGEIRAMELTSHPFFVATLFQPERRALRGEIPPLVSAFVESLAG